MIMQHKTIVLLGSDSCFSAIVYNILNAEFGKIHVLFEKRSPRWKIARRRALKLGWIKVIGQITFALLVVPILKRLAKDRIEQIIMENHLSVRAIPLDVITRVQSVNSQACEEVLRRLHPDVIVVCGARIISKNTLGCVPAPFINIHSGITPKYRGVHGAYWALCCGDPDSCGVTVHLVDAGIDTGGIAAQAMIRIEKADNFASYPFLQLAASKQLLISAVWNVFDRKLETKQGSGKSRLWHHPTIWGYLWNLMRRGVA